MNVFDKYPNFITTDVRKDRYPPNGYQVTSLFQEHKHSSLLPIDSIKGKTILDIGCCVAAAGGWVLENGASRYVGVELQTSFVQLAKQNLNKYFPNNDWEILESGFEEFLETNEEMFDIVLACGVMYSTLNYQTFINQISKIGKTVIIESNVPPILSILGIKELVESKNLLVSQFLKEGMVHESGMSAEIYVCYPSIKTVELLLQKNGFEVDYSANIRIQQQYKGLYNDFTRFVISGNKTDLGSIVEFKDCYVSNDETTKMIPWKKNYPSQFEMNLIREKKWEFNEEVANNFVNYAKRHIPNYIRVIDQCVDICRARLHFTESKIIDVGCATGETLRQLNFWGFTNITGVDASHSMLDECDSNISKLLCSDQFPVEDGPFDAVLCNWTLHFIQKKLEYLQTMTACISPDGFLILTDKTANSGFELEMYHNFKLRQGVSEEEIAAKAEAIKDVMFINSQQWYLDTLRSLGFKTVTIINAACCFTTFLAIK